MTLYFVSGLGADKRAFSRLKIPPHYKIVHLDWMEPDDNESLQAYVSRMAERINTAESFALIGLSFGGVVCTELSTILKPVITIIISSVTSRKEMPFHFRFLGKIKADTLVGAAAMKKEHFFSHWFFGTKLAQEQELFRTILRESSPGYVKWAVHEILNWKRQVRPENIVHIHGDKDKIFPIQFVKPDIIINGGEHFMVYTMADEVSKEINRVLSEIPQSI